MRSGIAGPASDGARRFEAPIPRQIRHAFANLEIECLIGQGGMGAVYKARQKSLDRLVAVKIFPRDAFDDPSFAERFAEEARILASLKHPNIVAAYDFGQTDEYFFLVMELVEGRSLRELIAGGEAASEAGHIIPQLCAALAYAHHRGIIHRDIKPDNILIEGGGDSLRVRVADFGLAKLVERQPGSFTLTAPQRLIGTPDYMAPEQRKTPAQVDHRADIYALGVVYYEMLTGELPIGRFKPPSSNPRLSALITRCLESDPAHRPRSISDFVAEHARISGKRRLSRIVAFTAAELALVALIVWGVVAYIRSRPTPPVNVAATGPVTQTQPITRAGPIDTFPRPFTPRAMGGGVNDYLERMRRDNGPQRVVTVFVDDLPGDVRSFVVERLGELSGASQTFTTGSPMSLTIHLAPVANIDALAKKIDFGKVARVDPEKRTIEVIADAKRLPTPLQPAVKDPADPQFYTRNLADLSAWDRTRRAEALSRHKTAPPWQLNIEINTALRKMLADPLRDIRSAAVEAVANWNPTDGDVEIARLLADSDTWVRQAALRALGQYKTDRAAQAVAAVLPDNRHEAAAALRKIGPAAEDVTLSLLNHTDDFVRLEAVKLLAEIGTTKSLKPLQAIAGGEHGLPKAAAPGAISAIQKRAAQK
jgi:tRNA A-37 threonylcarbamoyl transferase component Bud32/HEAT repeat protein